MAFLLEARLRAARRSIAARSAVDLPDVARLEANHEGAAAWFLLQQALGAEQLEGLADRASTHLETFRDLGLDQVLALGEPAREDLLPDPVRGVLGEGSGRLDRPEPHVGHPRVLSTGSVTARRRHRLRLVGGRQFTSYASPIRDS